MFASRILCGSALSWKTPKPAAAPVVTTTTSTNQRTFYFSGSVYTQGYIVTLNWAGADRSEEGSVYQDSLISVAFDESMKAVMDNEEQMEALIPNPWRNWLSASIRKRKCHSLEPWLPS